MSPPVFLHPEAQVAQKVPQNLLLGVVEALAVPLPVVAPVPGAEVVALLWLAPVKACTYCNA